MTAKTMADVLAEHSDWAWSVEHSEVLCIGCDWSQRLSMMDPAAVAFRAHQAAALTAAGFGLVADAKGEALEEAADAAADPSPEDMDDYFLDQSDVGRWLRARAAAVRES